jgi:MscS family membrane protein
VSTSSPPSSTRGARLLLALTLTLLLGSALPAQPVASQAVEGTPSATEAAPSGADSPRDLLRRFIESWNRATDADRRRGYTAVVIEGGDERRADLLTAIRLLETGRESRAPSADLYRAAQRVIDTLNYFGRIDYAEIPEAGEDRFELPTAHGPIVALAIEGGWYFERSFVEIGSARIIAAYEAEGAVRYQKFSLRTLMPEWLRERALFLEHWQWLGLASLLLLAWLVHRIATFIARVLLGRWSGRHAEGRSTSEAVRALGTAIGLFAAASVIALLRPYLELSAAGDRAVLLAAKVLASFGGMVLAYRLADLAGAWLRDAARRTDSRLDDQLAPMLERSLKVLITVGAFLFVLDNLDVDILSFLAGLGVVGIGVGLAARDTFANFFGSVTVFADKPFQAGDWIIVGSVEGTVEEIGFRTTRVRTFYNSIVSLPNASLVDSAIDNMGRRRWRRYRTRLGILYSTPSTRIEAFCEGIRQIVRANERMRQDYAMVYLNDFGGSALEVLVYVFFDVPDWEQELRARQDFMLEIIRLAEHLGVGFAFPTTTIHLESTPERPLPPPGIRSGEELRREAERFGPQGDLAHPEGSAAFPR